MFIHANGWQRLFLALLVFTVLGVTALVVEARSPIAVAEPRLNDPNEPWPPFVMVFRGTLLPDGNFVIAEMRYESERRWCLLELANTPPPGGTHIPLPEAACDEQMDRRESQRFYEFAAFWLKPARVPQLATIPDAQLIGGDGELMTVIAEEEDTRDDGSRIESRYEMTYRVADGIPLRYVLSVNGQVREVGEVLSLRFTNP